MKNLSSEKICQWLGIVVVLIYAVGLLLMLIGKFSQGLRLWFISTVAGALLLYVKRKREKRAADEKAVEEEEAAYQKRRNGDKQ